MKLLLKKDIAKLGIVGDIVDVSPGYARNYLIPKDLAMEPTEGNIRAIAKERAAAEERRRLAMEAMQQKAEELASADVTIRAAANPEGHLYGSVGPREIATALKELGHDVEPSKVKMSEPIRQLDTVVVDVVLAESIKTQVKVWVVPAGESESPQGEEETGEGKEPVGTEAEGDDEGGA